MGANASRIDEELAGLGADSSARNTHGSPSFFDSSERRSHQDMQSDSSQLTMLDTNSPTSLAGRSENGRLPPVEGYETVKSQIAQVTRWNLVESSEDLWVSTPLQDRETMLSPSLQLPIHQLSPTTHLRKVNRLATLNDKQSPKRHQSPPAIQLRKKRRLVLTPMAAQIATEPVGFQDVFPIRSSSDVQATFNDVQEDEGYDSFSISPTNLPGTTDAPCSNDEQEFDLVKSLANLQQAIVISTPVETSQSQKVDVGGSLEAAELLQAQEEQAGAERSRLLRERALIRQRAEVAGPAPLPDLDPISSDPLTSIRDEQVDGEMLSQETFEDFDTELRQPYVGSRLGPDESKAPSPEPSEEPDGKFQKSDDYEDMDQSSLFSDDEHTSAFEQCKLAVDHKHQTRTDLEHSKIYGQDMSGSSRPALNPLSRAAAEKFRTQDRHISQHNDELQKQHLPQSMTLQEREDRLRRLKTSSRPTQQAQITRTSVNDLNLSPLPASKVDPKLNDKTHDSPDTSPKSSHRPSGLEMLALKKGHGSFWDTADHRGASKAAATSQPQFQDVIDPDLIESEPGRTNPPHEPRSNNQSQTTSNHHPILSRRQGADADEEIATRSRSTSVSTKFERSLVLPKNFHTLKEEHQSIVVRHETLKERRRDLEVIDRVTRSIAQLRCAGAFTSREEKEIVEVDRFMRLVLRENKYGKLARKRIQDIRCNMDQRAQGFEADEHELTQWYRGLFDSKDLAKLKQSLSDIQGEISEVGAIRNEQVSSRHRIHKKKTVAFALPSSQNSTRVRHPARNNRLSVSAVATENRRDSQHAHQDRQIEEIRGKLLRFPTSLSEGPERASQGELGASSGNESDNESIVSEDTTGAEYYHAHPQNASAVADPQSQLDTTKQSDQEPPPPVPVVGSQRFDAQLLQQLRERHQARGIQANGESEAIKDGESETDTVCGPDEAEQEDDDDDDEEEEESPKQLFLYTLWGTFFGVQKQYPEYTDHDKYRFRKTYKVETAIEMMASLAQEFRYKHARAGIGADQSNTNIKLIHDLVEVHVDLGPDGEAGARFFMTRKAVSMSEKAYRRARAAQNIKVRESIYVVEWELRSTRLPERESESAPEDLTTTTLIPTSQLIHYNDIATANRQALRIYLDWHFRFLPGLENEYWRRLESEHAEKDLQRLGDWGLWNREETLEGMMGAEEEWEDGDQGSREGCDRDGGPDQGEGVEKANDANEGPDANQSGDRGRGNDQNKDNDEAETDGIHAFADFTPPQYHRVRQSFRVWVREAPVFGPGN